MSNQRRFRFRGIDEKYLHEASARTRDSAAEFHMAALSVEQPQHSPATIRSIADLNQFFRTYYAQSGRSIQNA